MFGAWTPHGFQDGGRDVDDMVELGADASLVLDPCRPGDHEAIAGAAEMAGDLFGPREGRVHRMRPADRVMVEGGRPAQLVHAALDFLEVFGRGVEEGHLVEQALMAALGTGTVVALDINDQSVVQLAGFLNRVKDAAI
jgi:hypothetical protein